MVSIRHSVLNAVLAGAVVLAALAVSGPARADWYRHGGGDRGWHDHGWHHGFRGGYGGGYPAYGFYPHRGFFRAYPPPVVYAPPPVYYAPVPYGYYPGY